MTPDMTLVLTALCTGYHDYEWGCLTFSGIAHRLETKTLDRKRIRFCCRALKRRGFAEFHKGLWTEDGEPYGAGYCCTKAGYDFINSLHEEAA